MYLLSYFTIYNNLILYKFGTFLNLRWSGRPLSGLSIAYWDRASKESERPCHTLKRAHEQEEGEIYHFFILCTIRNCVILVWTSSSSRTWTKTEFDRQILGCTSCRLLKFINIRCLPLQINTWHDFPAMSSFHMNKNLTLSNYLSCYIYSVEFRPASWWWRHWQGISLWLGAACERCTDHVEIKSWTRKLQHSCHLWESQPGIRDLKG